MSQPVVEIHALKKRYGRFTALDGLDLRVERGEVHGFLGPNGAGKTTALRCLLGLARPSGGQMTLLGKPVPHELPQVAHRVGALIDGPMFSPGLSVRRNLRLLAREGGVEEARVPEVLERLGIADRSRSRYGTLPRGLRRRLGIASALLGRPELLVLDEPTNGLDAVAVRLVRELITELAAGGTTVLVSSHVLAEVQQVCGAVTIIRDGRTVSSGRVDDVISARRTGTRVGVDDPDRGVEVLTGAGFSVRREGSDLLVEGQEPSEISRVLAGHDIYVRELSAVRPDLESVFLELTEDHDEPAEAVS